MASVTFQGPWHELDKQKVSEGLADLFKLYPHASVVCIQTGDSHDPYRAQVWDGSVHKTPQKPVEVYSLDILARNIGWCLTG